MNKIYFFFLAFIMVPLLSFSATWYVDCTVVESGNGTSPAEAFMTIAEAINCQSLAEYDTILILPGTYNEVIILSNTKPDHITICSYYLITGDETYIESTIIDGEGTNKGILISGPDGCTICGLTITDCYNNLNHQAAGITIGGITYSSSDTVIKNCIITDCSNVYNGGGGIRILKGPYCVIDSCTIENNTNNLSSSYGGGILIGYFGSYNYPTIKNCIIKNNTGGIYIGPGYYNFHDLLTIESSLICNNTDTPDGAGIDLEYCCMEMNKCTIINNSNQYQNHLDGISQCNHDDNYQYISNSIILDRSIFYEDDVIKFCGHLDDDIMEPDPTNGSTGNFETTAAECFVSEDDLYHLCWDSPCIDAGEISGTGPEGGMDIGYVPYPHSTWTFTQNGGILPTVYDWRSFPRLEVSDGENNGEFIEACAMLDKFEYPETPTDVDIWYDCLTSSTRSFYGDWNTSYYQWQYNPFNNFICSTRGFKFKVTDPDDDIPLRVFGEVCQANTSITIDGDEDENWVGYFLEDTQYVGDALDPTTLGYMDKIITKNWTAINNNGNWSWPIKPLPTLSYGDLVIFESDEDFSFTWQEPTRDEIEPYVRPIPTQFSYDEDLVYMPIYMEFEETPLEIAVYVDGVCRGAEVVETDSLFHLRAYVYEEEPGYELEFVQYFGRSETKVVDYEIIEMPNRSSAKLVTGNLSDWAMIKFGNPAEEEVPEQLTALAAYPNPFNPETTISFSTTEGTENTELSIYNVKGQKVKSLVNENLLGGEHSVIWKGFDDNGKQVSGGVYFLRLITGTETQTQKVVLLK